MITHFQYKPLYDNQNLPGWNISFFYQRQKFSGIYHPDGKIQWKGNIPEKDEDKIKSQIHELMLFHVYE